MYAGRELIRFEFIKKLDFFFSTRKSDCYLGDYKNVIVFCFVSKFFFVFFFIFLVLRTVFFYFSASIKFKQLVACKK